YTDSGGVCAMADEVPSAGVAGSGAKIAESTFEKHYRALHRYLVRRLPRAQDAHDVMQEVFLRLLRLDRGELVRKPQAYVYGIASHVVHEYRMREQHERITYDLHTLEQLTEHPDVLPLDELADRLALQHQLERTLADLPPTHQAVL